MNTPGSKVIPKSVNGSPGAWFEQTRNFQRFVTQMKCTELSLIIMRFAHEIVYLISGHKFGREFVFVGGVRQADERIIAVLHDGSQAAERSNGHGRWVGAADNAQHAAADVSQVSQAIVGSARFTRGQLQSYTNTVYKYCVRV